MGDSVRFDMGRDFVVVTSSVSRPVTQEERKRFVRDAAIEIAKEMIACGCVGVEEHYDLSYDEFRLFTVVRTGRKERKLPG